MTHAQNLAAFVKRASWEELSPQAREAIKLRVLDSLACALGALEGEPILALREHTDELGGNGLCSLVGGGRTAPDRAAFYNAALVRYLDFNDFYLAKGETCHPSDNVGPLLAAAELGRANGRTFLTALALAYQVQCRFCDVAPVRHRGFDSVTHGPFSVAAGASKVLGMESDQIVNAFAIAGTAYNPLRVTRAGRLSHWKGLAFPDIGRSALHATLLARKGITGPSEVFEGKHGWRETVSGSWDLDWSKEDLERVRWTDFKKYNAEGHSQSAIEGILELMSERQVSPTDIDAIHIEIFDVAFDIIGGGYEGEKTTIRTKEDADHSLPYMSAVAALDGQLLPAQYRTDRILREDVQSLLQRVTVVPSDEYSRRFPQEFCCKIVISTRGGQQLEKEKTDYEGFHTRPMSWEAVEAKFRHLSVPKASTDLQKEILHVVRHLDDFQVSDLMHLLASVSDPARPR